MTEPPNRVFRVVLAAVRGLGMLAVAAIVVVVPVVACIKTIINW